jgi:hypothetical protein
MTNYTDTLARAFERNSVFAHVHPWDLYRSWLEAIWALLDAACNPEGYKACLDRYSYQEGAEFARILGLYIDALEQNPFVDILGELFMRLDIRSVQAGQFFTPWPVVLMMARMQFDAEVFKQTVSDKGVVTVCDPACGSGVMLLAFAQVVYQELGDEGLSRLELYGQDIDLRCVNMCRIQIRMNGLDAIGRMARLAGSRQRGQAPSDPALLPGLAA